MCEPCLDHDLYKSNMKTQFWDNQWNLRMEWELDNITRLFLNLLLRQWYGSYVKSKSLLEINAEDFMSEMI